MSILDIILGIILIFSVINGIKDGLIKNIFFLLGTILGLFLATKYNSVIVPQIMKYFHLGAVESQIISYILLFTIIALIMRLFCRLLVKSNNIIAMWDKIFGGVLGLLESCIILSLILILLHSFNFPSQDVIDSSVIYPKIYNFAPTVFDYVKVIIPGTGSFFEEFNILI
jgi:membrane protein required for colicin V production